MAENDTATAARDQAAAKLHRETQVRAALNSEFERVTNESRPTPTQEECDLAKLGLLHPDDKQTQDDLRPMPPLHEQRAALEAAATGDEHQDRSAAEREAAKGRREQAQATARAQQQPPAHQGGQQQPHPPQGQPQGQR